MIDAQLLLLLGPSSSSLGLLLLVVSGTAVFSGILFSADVFSWESTVYLRNCGLGCPRAWRWPIRDEVHPYRALGLLRLLTPLPRLLLFTAPFLYIYIYIILCFVWIYPQLKGRVLVLNDISAGLTLFLPFFTVWHLASLA